MRTRTRMSMNIDHSSSPVRVASNFGSSVTALYIDASMRQRVVEDVLFTSLTAFAHYKFHTFNHSFIRLIATLKNTICRVSEYSHTIRSNAKQQMRL